MNSKTFKIIFAVLIIVVSVLIHNRISKTDDDNLAAAFSIVGESLNSENDISSAFQEAYSYAFKYDNNKIISAAKIEDYIEKVKR